MSKEIHDLLLDVQKKDRRFRLFQSSAILLVLFLLLVVVVAQFQTLGKVREQLTEQKRINSVTTERAESERKDIIRRLNCMVAFFSIPDRENLSIYDVERCAVTYTVLPQDYFMSVDTLAQPSPPASPQAIQPKEEPKQPAQQPTPPATAPPQPESEPSTRSFVRGARNFIKGIIGG